MHDHLMLSIAAKLAAPGDATRLTQQAHDCPKAGVVELCVAAPGSSNTLRVTRHEGVSGGAATLSPTLLEYGGHPYLHRPGFLLPHPSECHVSIHMTVARWGLLLVKLLADGWTIRSEAPKVVEEPGTASDEALAVVPIRRAS